MHGLRDEQRAVLRTRLTGHTPLDRPAGAGMLRRMVTLSRFAAPLILLAATSATAQQGPDYLDDRSDGPTLVRSYYNAVDRQEYARAYAYFGDAPPVPTYDAFARGYADTVRTELRLGPDQPDADMGGVTHGVGVVLRAIRADGSRQVFTGCYLVRQPAWWKTDPPVFSPLHIGRATLAPSSESFERAMIPSCLD